MLKSSSLTEIVCILPGDKLGKPVKYTDKLARLVCEQDAQGITGQYPDWIAMLLKQIQSILQALQRVTCTAWLCPALACDDLIASKGWWAPSSICCSLLLGGAVSTVLLFSRWRKFHWLKILEISLVLHFFLPKMAKKYHRVLTLNLRKPLLYLIWKF